MYTTQAQVRMAFWEGVEGLNRQAELKTKRSRPDKSFRTDVRCAFVDFIDRLHRDGLISDKMAAKVTLK